MERRFEVVTEAQRITVVDDYAHHPTEIRAALETARALCRGRLIAVFHKGQDFLRVHARFPQACPFGRLGSHGSAPVHDQNGAGAGMHAGQDSCR